MEQGIKNARVKATGHIVQVYLHHGSGDYVNAQDCVTTYKVTEIEFMS
jgi:hypothetical protein